eukprot:92586-Hanusia_phi.AAC.1
MCPRHRRPRARRAAAVSPRTPPRGRRPGLSEYRRTGQACPGRLSRSHPATAIAARTGRTVESSR